MIRFLLTLTFYASVARFLCTEAVLIAPFTKPLISSVVAFTTIPPHTAWNKDKMAKYAAKVLPDSKWAQDIANDEKPLERLAEKAKQALRDLDDSELRKF